MTNQVSLTAGPAEQESEVRTILAQAIVFERSKEPRLAHAQFRRAQSLAKKYFGKSHRLYAECMHNLALFNHTQGDFVASRSDVLKALEALDGCSVMHEMHDDPLWQNLVLLLQHL